MPELGHGQLNRADRPLGLIAGWPSEATAGVVTATGGLVSTAGPVERPYPWASVTKILTALAVWIAVEEGIVAWDDPAGPPGSTLAHLLAHASGLGPDSSAVLARPGTRRIYSNRGIEVAAEHLAAEAGMPFAEYLSTGVIEPLGLRTIGLEGSPASGASGSLRDLMALGAELLHPSLVSPGTVARTTAVAFPGLRGVLPGFGSQEHNDWGLGVEVRDSKRPHWTGSLNSPATFGHFGQSGSFLWADPELGLALGALAGVPFGPWAAEAWPVLADAVIQAYQADPAHQAHQTEGDHESRP
jgi:CubicO group peptidase (beta-lactamase class C family)